MPKEKIDNSYFNKVFNLDDEWIYKRTGIKARYFSKSETNSEMSIKACKKLIENLNFDAQKIDCIIVTTVSSEKLMPGISFDIQKALDIKKCMCFDILAGCSGFINAVDIARKYITLGEAQNALVVGVERLSNYLDYNDINTSILLGDAAGAVLLGRTDENKIYASNIESIVENNQILTCNNNQKLFMDGLEVYKFAVTQTIRNINELLEKSNESIDNIKYIVLHQSNMKILTHISKRLGITMDKIYTNLENVGNTFCASIPMVLSEMYDKNLLKENDKIILAGYGGGLNLGSILLEI